MRTLPPRIAPAGAIALAGVLLASLMPATTLAGELQTVYVAPGGPVTAQFVGGSCETPDYGLIQDAIDFSSPGDTIIVCDGVYPQQAPVSIAGSGLDGLTIRGESPWGATIVGPADGDDGSILAIDNADDVSIVHLRFRPRADCTSNLSEAIRIEDSLDVDFRSNRVINLRNALGKRCGFGEGIVTWGSTGQIRYNLIQDWRRTGIWVRGSLDGGQLRVIRNSLRYRHDGVEGIYPTYSNGITVEVTGDGVSTVVRRNIVTSPPTAGIRPSNTPMLTNGITWTSDNMTVRDNFVGKAETGIAAYGGTNAVVVGNKARGTGYDCYSDVGTDGWSDNDGRPEKSWPDGLCSLP